MSNEELIEKLVDGFCKNSVRYVRRLERRRRICSRIFFLRRLIPGIEEDIRACTLMGTFFEFSRDYVLEKYQQTKTEQP